MATDAVLCYIFNGDKVLLINKKTGFGKGRINGPGGKMEIGETPQDTAKRELKEELRIEPINPEVIGELSFYFDQKEKIDWKVFVLKSERWTGKAEESEDAKPLWTHKNEIPYDNMWKDDIHWMPFMFEGKCFKGDFFFNKDGSELVEHKVEVVNKLPEK